MLLLPVVLGLCIARAVVAVECGAGTVLDPATNTCIAQNAVGNAPQTATIHTGATGSVVVSPVNKQHLYVDVNGSLHSLSKVALLSTVVDDLLNDAGGLEGVADRVAALESNEPGSIKAQLAEVVANVATVQGNQGTFSTALSMLLDNATQAQQGIGMLEQRVDALESKLDINAKYANKTLDSLDERVRQLEDAASSYGEASVLADAVETIKELQREISFLKGNVSGIQAQLDASQRTFADCADIYDFLGSSMRDGTYTVTGGDSGDEFSVYCLIVGNTAWTLALNLDTSDGHVMWWGNDLWFNEDLYQPDASEDAWYKQDRKMESWNRLRTSTHLLIMVHEQGSLVGWRSFELALAGTTLGGFFRKPCTQSQRYGCNQVISDKTVGNSVSSINTRESLVRLSGSLYANHIAGANNDLDRLASPESAPVGSDNHHGALGNWHDAPAGKSPDGRTSIAGWTLAPGAAFRTTSEAQGGWCNYNGQSQGTFGSDTFAAFNCNGEDNDKTKAGWAGPNGVNYDFAVFLTRMGRSPPTFKRPAKDCTEVAQIMGTDMHNGLYWITGGGVEPFQAHCILAGGIAWTLVLNVDTSDGHVMWWGNDLWTNDQLYNDYGAAWYAGDRKPRAWNDLQTSTHVMIMLHEQGRPIGWRSWTAGVPNQPMRDYFPQCTMASMDGCDVVLGKQQHMADVGNIHSIEKLVRTSTVVYANHRGGAGGGDLDRIASTESAPLQTQDNFGGGIGNWHDAPRGRSPDGRTVIAGITLSTGSGFRTTSEAQPGWCDHGGKEGAYGSDTFAAFNCGGGDSDPTKAGWSTPNGNNYDYAVFMARI